jgi:hypothetical protein
VSALPLANLAGAGQIARARRLLAAADEQRTAACSLGDSQAILDANGARYRARGIIADLERELLGPAAPTPPRADDRRHSACPPLSRDNHRTR